MAIPMGPGNTDKQIQMMMDLKSTVLTATSSYALLLAEEINKRGIRDQLYLKKGILVLSAGVRRCGNILKGSLEFLFMISMV